MSPSRQGWALLLLAVVVAAVLRFWQFGEIPPGFYRDEAYNGLDALGVLSGEHALFFPANNGREPAYIYLTALAVMLFGQTVTAVRLTAAVVGTLTTPIFYLLGNAWFGKPVGLLAAWLWAVAFWPVHISRVGFRTVLFVAAITLAFWLGTTAFRREKARWWIAAGIVYALTFYTYLAARFTPVLLLALLLFLLALPAYRQRLWPGAAWFAGAALVGLLPLLAVALQDSNVLLGRSQQVSILNPAINGGDFWGTLWRQLWLGLGLTIWRGDAIWRHNLPGRPALDFLMALPFLIGVGTGLRRWRNPALMASLLWLFLMLWPTILAEDAPHFLRAVGVLPPLLLLTALGLSKLWDWPKLPSVFLEKWPAAGQRRWRTGFVVLLCAATLLLTVYDYFLIYAGQAETAYFFEAAARDLAEQINSEPAETAVYVDNRFSRDSLPAVDFLVAPTRQITAFESQVGPLCAEAPAACALPLSIYAWPYAPLGFMPELVEPPAEVTVDVGSSARGDLEAEAYPFFVRYHAAPYENKLEPLADFAERMQLISAHADLISQENLRLNLVWTAKDSPEMPVKIFVHVVDEDGNIVAQSDAYPAGGHWPVDWWRPGLFVREQHELGLDAPFDAAEYDILIGVYDPATNERLPLLDAAGNLIGDAWLLPAIETR